MPAENLTKDEYRAPQTVLPTAAPARKYRLRGEARRIWADRTLRRWPHGWVLWLVVGLVVAPVAVVGILIAVDRTFFSVETQVCFPETTQTSRSKPQRILDGVVGGPSKLAPGATAYVSGPHGSWLGAAGVADTSTCAQMPMDARMRLESVSKIYAATLILQLAQEGKLRVGDTVDRWLPGLLPSYGNRITIRQLLTMSSGLIDNNDFNNASDSVKRAYLGRVKDAKLRAQLLATLARVEEDHAVVVPETLWIRWAAWQPVERGQGLAACLGGDQPEDVVADVRATTTAAASPSSSSTPATPEATGRNQRQAFWLASAVSTFIVTAFATEVEPVRLGWEGRREDARAGCGPSSLRIPDPQARFGRTDSAATDELRASVRS